LESLLRSDNLRGLPTVFNELRLLRNEGGVIVLETESDPLAEMLTWINNKSDYGTNPSGKALESEFGGSPYGWDVDVVKLFALCLLRSGQLTITSQGGSIESVFDSDAIDAFTNNVRFRACTFRPKKVLDFAEIVKAADAFEKTFGEKIANLTQDEVVKAIRDKSLNSQRNLRQVLSLLERNHLPGGELFSSTISQLEHISTANEEETILRFGGSFAKLKDALTRAADISQKIAAPQLQILHRAHTVLSRYWPFLSGESSTSDLDREQATELSDLMQRETFYRELPRIDQASAHFEQLYQTAFTQSVNTRKDCYTVAVETLKSTSGWEHLNEDRQTTIAEPLESRATAEVAATTPIPQLKADIDACDKRLSDAVAEIHRFIEGDRVVRVKIGRHFSSGIDTEEQLDAALGSLREECIHYIVKNKRVLIQ
jgi:hypothetical protein